MIYVLRDADSGAILKVGKTVGGPSARRRFGVYRRAGEKLGLKLRIEVTTVPKVRGTKVEVHEKALRARLEGEGHIMPWDNSPEAVGRLREGRLGRPGAGTPYDSLRAALRRSHRWIDGWLVPDGE